MEISSNRPYLIRALYDWLVDNRLTPHMLVDADRDDVIVPEQYIEDGRIVLNISPTAVRDLELGNEFIRFNARFGGAPMDVIVPPAAVLGLYSREQGHGMLFPDEKSERDGDGSNGDDPEPSPPRDRPTLKVVK